MAMQNELVGIAARYNELLTRKFGIIGGAPSPQLTPEITPVVEINDLPIEDRFITRERTYEFTESIGATALTAPRILITNPAGSNLLLIVQGLWSESGTDVISYFAGAFSPFGTNLGGVTAAVDTRQGVAAANKSAAQISFDNLGVPGATSVEYFVNAAVEYVTREFVISPGFGFALLGQNINRGAFAGFRWRERPALAQELLA